MLFRHDFQFHIYHITYIIGGLNIQAKGFRYYRNTENTGQILPPVYIIVYVNCITIWVLKPFIYYSSVFKTDLVLLGA